MGSLGKGWRNGYWRLSSPLPSLTRYLPIPVTASLITFFYFPFNHSAVKARKESRNNGYEKEEKPPECIFACFALFH